MDAPADAPDDVPDDHTDGGYGDDHPDGGCGESGMPGALGGPGPRTIFCILEQPSRPLEKTTKKCFAMGS